jgi:hypothetical protein
MSDLIYHEVLPISRNDAEIAFSSNDESKLGDALVGLAYYDPDWKRVQDICLDFVTSPFPNVRHLSIICLGHLARIHETLEMEKVMPLLESLRDSEEFGVTVEGTLEDIDIFIEK